MSLFLLCQQAIHLHCDTPTKGAAPHHPHQIHHVCVSWPCTLNIRHRNYFLALPTHYGFPPAVQPPSSLSCSSPTSLLLLPVRQGQDQSMGCGSPSILLPADNAADRGQSALMSQHSVCAYARKAAGVQGSTVCAYGVHTGTTHVRRFVDARGPRLAFVCK
jgi:hypothetical protein